MTISGNITPGQMNDFTWHDFVDGVGHDIILRYIVFVCSHNGRLIESDRVSIENPDAECCFLVCFDRCYILYDGEKWTPVHTDMMVCDISIYNNYIPPLTIVDKLMIDAAIGSGRVLW